jgi:hypothetical protein
MTLQSSHTEPVLEYYQDNEILSNSPFKYTIRENARGLSTKVSPKDVKTLDTKCNSLAVRRKHDCSCIELASIFYPLRLAAIISNYLKLQGKYSQTDLPTYLKNFRDPDRPPVHE